MNPKTIFRSECDIPNNSTTTGTHIPFVMQTANNLIHPSSKMVFRYNGIGNDITKTKMTGNILWVKYVDTGKPVTLRVKYGRKNRDMMQTSISGYKQL